MTGVPGGGSTRENSAASELSGVCFGESAIKRLVFNDSNCTSDCGEMSCAKPVPYDEHTETTPL